MNMKYFWQRQLLLLLLRKHSMRWGQVAGGSEGAGLLKSVTAKTNIVADIIVGQVDCLQFCMSKAKSFMPNIIINDK